MARAVTEATNHVVIEAIAATVEPIVAIGIAAVAGASILAASTTMTTMKVETAVGYIAGQCAVAAHTGGAVSRTALTKPSFHFGEGCRRWPFLFG